MSRPELTQQLITPQFLMAQFPTAEVSPDQLRSATVGYYYTTSEVIKSALVLGQKIAYSCSALYSIPDTFEHRYNPSEYRDEATTVMAYVRMNARYLNYDIARFVVVFSSIDVFEDLSYYSSFGPELHVLPQDVVLPASYTKMDTRWNNALTVPVQNIVYHVPRSHFFYFVCNKHITVQNKFFSIASHLFPYIEGHLDDTFTPMDYSRVENAMVGTLPSTIAMNEALSNQIRGAIVFMFMCKPAFRQDANIQTQLFTRYKAACASILLEPLRDDLYRHLVEQLGIVTLHDNPRITQILGFILNVDNKGHYNPLLKEAQLLMKSSSQLLFQFDNFTWAILEQMKLVYRNHNQVSINIALSMFEYLGRNFRELGEAMSIEYDKFSGIIEKVKDRPFIGCNMKLDEDIQVSAVPRVVMASLLLYKKCLTVEKDIKNFEAFKISAIIEKVTSAAHQELIISYVSMLAPPTYEAQARVLATSNAIDSTAFLDAMKPENRRVVVTLLKHKYPDCSYSKDLLHQENMEKLHSLEKILYKTMDSRFSDKIATAKRAINAIDDENVRNRANAMLKDIQRDYANIINGESSTLVQAIIDMNIPESPVFDRLRLTRQAVDGIDNQLRNLETFLFPQRSMDTDS